MGWLIALAVVAGLAILPLGISARYDANGPLVQFLIGPIRIQMYPKKNKAKIAKKQGSQTNTQQTQNQGGKLSEFLPILREVWELLVDFRHKLRVNLLQLHLVLAEDDPCDLAVHYGDTWAVLEGIMPQIERFFIIKKKDIQIDCDFTAEHTRICARLDFTITLSRFVMVLLFHGSKVLREFLKIIKSRKGGAQI